MRNLRALSDDDLLHSLDSLMGSRRQLEAHLIRHLIEIEERRLDLQHAYSSLWEFCTARLKMSEGEAFRRITAARLARKFPVILSLIESGSVCLSALVLLRDHLTDENHRELLERVGRLSKRELQAVLAAKAPKPDAPSKIRKLPELTGDRGSPLLDLEPVPAPPRPAPKPLVEPLSEARYKVQFTASEALKRKLDRAKDLLSHANPSGDLALIVERAMDLLIAQLEKTRRGRADRPRKSTKRKTAASGVAREDRRGAFGRDGEQCSYVGPDGRRCTATAFLEIDHIESRALGGSDESHNLRVRCRAHNKLWAEQTFGREHVERQIDLRQHKTNASGSNPADDRRDKLIGALTRLGFNRARARAALARVQRDLDPTASAEELVRAAILMLSG